MLSVEEECEEGEDAQSPTSSGAASDATAFKMSLNVSGSEASRLEDALFRCVQQGLERRGMHASALLCMAANPPALCCCL